MSVVRNRPKGARASFGLGLCVFALIPNEIGYQDIASLLARQPGVAERWRSRVAAPSVSSIQLATFSLARPMGTGSRNPSLQIAGLTSENSDVTGSIPRNPLLRTPRRFEASDYPVVDRSVKGDRLVILHPGVAAPSVSHDVIAPEDPTINLDEPTAPSHDANGRTASHGPNDALDPELSAALDDAPLAQYDAGVLPGELHDTSAGVAAAHADDAPAHHVPFSVKTTNLFFGASAMGHSISPLEDWHPGAEPIIVPRAMIDTDLKKSSLETPAAAPAGESIATKGTVNGAESRAKTPAERMGLLDDKARAKQERCLANAVYFEARGEAVRGQIAVAQVVMNRVFSGFYPSSVCGVVYQNAHRKLACQFTFACDGIPDVVREPDMMDRARKIAKATLDGRLWLPEVGKSTHYHAYWVRPSWVHSMRKMYKTGVHTFYRPRRWGDGGDAPSWGTPEQTAEISATLAAIKP